MSTQQLPVKKNNVSIKSELNVLSSTSLKDEEIIFVDDDDEKEDVLMKDINPILDRNSCWFVQNEVFDCIKYIYFSHILKNIISECATN